MSPRRVYGLWNVALGMAVISLLVALFVGWKQYDLVNCLAGKDQQVRTRTSAIAGPTDAERAADLKLLREKSEQARQDAIAAREYTDRVRAANPAPDSQRC